MEDNIPSQFVITLPHSAILAIRRLLSIFHYDESFRKLFYKAYYSKEMNAEQFEKIFKETRDDLVLLLEYLVVYSDEIMNYDTVLEFNHPESKDDFDNIDFGDFKIEEN